MIQIDQQMFSLQKTMTYFAQKSQRAIKSLKISHPWLFNHFLLLLFNLRHLSKKENICLLGIPLVELERMQIRPEIQYAFQECPNSHCCFSHLLPSFSAGAGICSPILSDDPFFNGYVPTMSSTWTICFRHPQNHR